MMRSIRWSSKLILFQTRNAEMFHMERGNMRALLCLCRQVEKAEPIMGGVEIEWQSCHANDRPLPFQFALRWNTNPHYPARIVKPYLRKSADNEACPISGKSQNRTTKRVVTWLHVPRTQAPLPRIFIVDPPCASPVVDGQTMETPRADAAEPRDAKLQGLGCTPDAAVPGRLDLRMGMKTEQISG